MKRILTSLLLVAIFFVPYKSLGQNEALRFQSTENPAKEVFINILLLDITKIDDVNKNNKPI